MGEEGGRRERIGEGGPGTGDQHLLDSLKSGCYWFYIWLSLNPIFETLFLPGEN